MPYFLQMQHEFDDLRRPAEAVDQRLADLPVLVRARAEYLRRQAEYLRDADTVPIAASCAEIPLQLTAGDSPAPASDRRLSVNVLGEEYWEIYSVLLN